jgi:hypothetical protein
MEKQFERILENIDVWFAPFENIAKHEKSPELNLRLESI